MLENWLGFGTERKGKTDTLLGGIYQLPCPRRGASPVMHVYSCIDCEDPCAALSENIQPSTREWRKGHRLLNL